MSRVARTLTVIAGAAAAACSSPTDSGAAGGDVTAIRSTTSFGFCLGYCRATLGCPDRADGGAESLEVLARDWRDGVTFELGAAMPQLQPLLERMRELRGRFAPTTAPR